MKRELPKYFYSTRNTFSAAFGFSVILSASIIVLHIWDTFRYRYHIPTILTATEFVFCIACCFVSYFLASGIVFYGKLYFQRISSSWLIISIIGSIIFTILLTVFDYVNTNYQIKNYNKPSFSEISFSISGDFGPPELPTFEEVILFVFATAIATFLNTSLIYSLWQNFYDVFLASKGKIINDL